MQFIRYRTQRGVHLLNLAHVESACYDQDAEPPTLDLWVGGSDPERYANHVRFDGSHALRAAIFLGLHDAPATDDVVTIVRFDRP